jgi:omega-hydroxy-beta-dihydromenaquinone-9 sulfotransferase
LCTAYLEERKLIPPERLVEISYGQLEADPLAAMRDVYQALDLPDFAYVEPVLTNYLGSLADYRRNVFPEIRDELRARIGEAWRPWFEQWGYSF